MKKCDDCGDAEKEFTILSAAYNRARIKKNFLFLLLLVPLIGLACVASAMGGRVSSPIIRTEAPIEEVIATVQDNYFVCHTQVGLNVRGGPAAKGRIYKVLPPGGEVRVWEWSGGWAMIEPGLWVNGDYLCK